MNIDYISGFFDADGSITLSYSSKRDIYRTITIDFSNTKLSILLDIQDFLFKTYNIKGFISKKEKRKENHSTGYTLSIRSNQKCLQLCTHLKSIHPLKCHRINVILKYHNLVTKRNGKYSPREHTRRIAYERLFFSSIFQ